MRWRMDLLKEGFDPEEIMEKAISLGHFGHKCAEEQRLVNAEIAPQNIIRMLRHLKNFLQEYKPEYDETEKEVHYVGPAGTYSGHIDILGKIRKEDWLVDTKTHGLYKEYDEQESFRPMIAAQKAKGNLQTWLYSLTEGGIYTNHKRAILHLNQYGFDFVELKRLPKKDTQERVFSILREYNKTHIF